MNPTKHQNFAILILLLAAILRFWELGIKPPHFDEGVNGWFVDQITKTGFFTYDPTNYHGPLHFYILFVMQSLFGRSIEVLRVPGVLAGIGTVWVALFGFRRHLGGLASLLFGFFLAISPAMVFVSRYAIHEIWLLLFLILACWGVMELWGRVIRRGVWLLLMGITGMILMKETYILHLACMLLAWPTWWLVNQVFPENTPPATPEPGFWKKLGLEFAGPFSLGVLLILFFYSGNFLNFPALQGLYKTFEAWSATGMENSGHDKPWYYWLELMQRYEWAALLGVLASVWFIRPTPAPIRWLVIAGVGTAVAYSLIPYKTPWCVIVIIWTFPMALAWVLAQCWKQGWLIPCTLVFLAVTVHDLSVAWRLNFREYDNPAEPYVYVQTSRELRRFVDPLRAAAKRNPTIPHAPGAVVVDSSFPLGWWIGDFTHVGYYKKDIALNPNVMDFLLVEETRRAEIEAVLEGEWFTSSLRLRDGYEPVFAYFKRERFAPEFAESKPTQFLHPQEGAPR